MADTYPVTVTPAGPDNIALTPVVYMVELIDPCSNVVITASELAPLTYVLDGSGIASATVPAFTVDPPYCLKEYQIDIPAAIEKKVVTGDATSLTIATDLAISNQALAGSYSFTVTPVLRDGTV